MERAPIDIQCTFSKTGEDARALIRAAFLSFLRRALGRERPPHA